VVPVAAHKLLHVLRVARRELAVLVPNQDAKRVEYVVPGG